MPEGIAQEGTPTQKSETADEPRACTQADDASKDAEKNIAKQPIEAIHWKKISPRFFVGLNRGSQRFENG